jgi:thiosulfate dehydrogenase [quinone] large subunit
MASLHDLTTTREGRHVVALRDSAVATALFSDVRWSWIWLIVRLYVGVEWLRSGIGKLTSPVWTGDQAGTAITGFVNGALNKTGGEHPDVQAWYATFLRELVLPHATFWSYLVTGGEILVGTALIIGLFTGIAAFFGAFMSANFLLAGTVSTNPIMLMLALLLVVAWKTAGWWGLDRWVLPALGTPWSPGLVFTGGDLDAGVGPGDREAEPPARAA